MKSRYIKPWTILIVLSAILAAVFMACKNEVEIDEPDYLGGDMSNYERFVELEKGSVILTDQGAFILSDNKMWNAIDSLKSIIIPFETYYDRLDLSGCTGRNIVFSGKLHSLGEDTISIKGEKQNVNLYRLHPANIKFSDGSRAGDSSKQVICGTQFTDED